jgi:ABC-2 type transport system permease protein
MNAFVAAFQAETLKARRGNVWWLTAAGFSLAPLVGGLFMIILKDPARAREMGLIGAKAQLAAGVADWPTFFGMLAQAVAVGGSVLFSIITTWVFGREFADRTAKELLALPASRTVIVAAKFALIVLWGLALTLYIFVLGLVVGRAVDIPGWSAQLQQASFWVVLGTALMTLLLMSSVALFASAGRGYLPPLGWMFFTVFLAQIAAATGWGGWFPWSVPALFSGMAGPSSAEQLGPQSYVLVLLAVLAGLAATFVWWLRADHSR